MNLLQKRSVAIFEKEIHAKVQKAEVILPNLSYFVKV